MSPSKHLNQFSIKYAVMVVTKPRANDRAEQLYTNMHLVLFGSNSCYTFEFKLVLLAPNMTGAHRFLIVVPLCDVHSSIRKKPIIIFYR